MWEKHGSKTDELQFWALEMVKLGPKKSDLTNRLLQKEAKWSFALGSMSPNGINEGFIYTPLI